MERLYDDAMTLPAPSGSTTALVTGASSGIGAQIARELAGRGHHVTLVARSVDKLEALATELGDADVIGLDLADRDARASLAGQVADNGRTVEILVNNAGLSTLGPVSRATVEDELHMVELDVAAVVELCTRFVPGMVDAGRGAVLNVASTAAFQPLPGQAGYGASKAFVLSYTQSLAVELRGTGVTATTLCPGPVETGFGERAGFDQADAEAALPKIMWVDAAAVARTAVDATDKGRLVVIPGVANRIASVAAHLTPRTLLLPLLAKGHPGLRRDLTVD